ncbi:hypothetical protein [Streptomyces niveus]|uniref:DUF4352 domain-containing protein n=1 Tax=Streptomyces niveus TaxID=193462 RepID=A0A1U9R0Z5_STRNV|nr:hypothetical protein [Streptomyces niveus]AQU70100.1 hypothetical protein BBN63_31905 [Streptomyces niveus]
MRTTAAVCGAITLIVLVGCSNTDDGDGPVPAAAAPADASTTPAPDPAPAAKKIGHAHRWEASVDGLTAAGSTTVLSYEQPAKGASSPGDGLGLTDPQWAVVEVKVCNTGPDHISASQSPWTLAFPDDTRAQTTGLNGGDLPKPEFPTLDTPVRAGDCLRGKIPFAVEHGIRPDRIMYTPGESEPVEWTVPAK